MSARKVGRNMTTQDKLKTKDTERIREQAFKEGYEAGFQAARKKNRVSEDSLPQAAIEYARKAYRLDGVEQVYARVGKVLYIRTKVRDTSDDALMRLIFEVEGQMYDAFPDHGHEIDFHPMDDRTRRSKYSLERSGFNLIPRETPVAVG